MPPSLVVLPQLVAKPPGVDPHDRIGTTVEVRPLPVQLVGQDRFFEDLCLPAERLVDDERQEAAQLVRALEDCAGEDAIELRANRRIRWPALSAATRAGEGQGAPRDGGV